MIDFEQLKVDIAREQVKEKSYKGRINHTLYLHAFSEDNDFLLSSVWINCDYKYLERFLEKAKQNPRVIKVILTNGFFDWDITLYTKGE